MKTQHPLMRAGLVFIAASALLLAWGSSSAVAQTSPTLAPYVDRLYVPGVMQPTRTVFGVDHYEVTMRAFSRKLHRDLPPTRLWGYNGKFPGDTFETRRNRPIRVKWINDLPRHHALPVDNTLHGVMDTPEVRTVVHLHGANVRPDSDGYPEHWFTSDPHAAPNGLGGPAGNFDIYDYPNRQQATTLWYHDHALGSTRLNVYTGLTGIYIIRDEFDDLLPLPRGRYELPLII